MKAKNEKSSLVENKKKTNRSKKWLKVTILVLGDILVMAILYGLWILGSLNLYEGWSGSEVLSLIIYSIVAILLTIGIFAICKIYRMLIDNFGIIDAMQLAIVSFLVSISLYLLMAVIHYTHDTIYPILGFTWDALPLLDPYIWVLMIICQIFLLIFVRYAKRIFLSVKNRFGHQNENAKRTIVIGAGAGARIVIDEARNNKKSDSNIIVLVDDDPNKIGASYSGFRVLGPISNVKEFIEKYKIERAIIAIADLSKERLHEIIGYLVPCDVQIKRLPLLTEMSNLSETKVMNVDLDELLNRDVVNLDNKEIKTMLNQQSVLVTGAGGSIGSELVRQIFNCHPKTLVLFDIYEHGVYALQMELYRRLREEHIKDIKVVVLIGSVYNAKRLEKVFKKYHPDYVYHAAAYKHVPLMEDSPEEAIRSNCIGTYNTAMLSDKYHVKKMVLVSTDKAVRPTNTMGATKRFAEMVIQYYSSISKDTKYAAVRFGNVLGSNGSVIPLFTKQIEAGGPITVTDPNITRFFMTIPEAVSLILQSSLYATGGEIFILDMGKPVKILDLAKNMIRQAGFVPDVDIKIEYVGLRPGEKLYEEILVNPEEHKKTENSKIYVEKKKESVDITNYLTELEKVFDMEDDLDIKKELAKVVKTYKVDSKTLN
jgi:FlaA1/EpsC-like NDP-sugar epimerase